MTIGRNTTMKNLVEVNYETHGKLCVAEGSTARFAAVQHLMQIHTAEVLPAVCSFPVFFSRAPGAAHRMLAVVLSFEIGKNLFVEDEHWTATFMPAGLQTYPLYLMKSEADKKGYAVGIIGHDNVLATDSGNALFNDDGEPSEYLTTVTEQLEASIQRDIQTRLFAQRLDQLGLMKSISINIQFEDGAEQKISGLQTVDEDKLRALPAETLEELNKKGYLLLIHAMLVSIYQLNTLIQKNNQTPGSRAITQAKIEPADDETAAEPAS